jgi:hypothetical protein
MHTMIEYSNNEELQVLTNLSRAAAQASWLKEKSIPHRVDSRRVIVSRAHIRDWLEGRVASVSSGPNWGALNRAKGN